MTRHRIFRAILPAASLALIVAAGCATLPAAQAAQREDNSPSATSVSTAVVEPCPMAIANPPPVGADGKTIGGPLVVLNGVELLLQPATKVCLSSGYGQRNGRAHRGVDYHTRTSGDVLAAADGTILEATTRADFGAMIVIDHGAGVYTRYAHLASFSAPAIQGARIRRGEVLGPIGATGATSVRHLHYEILSGKYVSGVGSFGLATHNPFGLPSP